MTASPLLTRQALAAQQEPARTKPITLFLAASLQPVLQRLLEANPRLKASLVPASSGLLARQIYFGAPCDIYITAHPKWSTWLAEKRVKIIAQRTFLSNRLALISSISTSDKESENKTVTQALRDREFLRDRELSAAKLRALLHSATRIAIGDPSHVPVGGYAQQAFVALGLDEPAFTSRLVPLVNTRATTLHVERAEADLGIVYLSDALQAKHSRLEGLLPANLHDPISYDMLLLDEGARELYDFLSSAEASQIFAEQGFIPLAR